MISKISVSSDDYNAMKSLRRNKKHDIIMINFVLLVVNNNYPDSNESPRGSCAYQIHCYINVTFIAYLHLVPQTTIKLFANRNLKKNKNNNNKVYDQHKTASFKAAVFNKITSKLYDERIN